MMTYFKIIPWFFLAFAALFLYEGITRLNTGEDPVIPFLFTGVGIFMFFFKKWQYRKAVKK
jgi:divalent metal cation (Fe/Co/Zn/Cd) transporter